MAFAMGGYRPGRIFMEVAVSEERIDQDEATA